jgi:TetR/AcrR family transcriptional regulator, tetracycline repressor protein
MPTHVRAPARVPLTRERILTCALGLIDERGLDELTMRALGSELGVEAMSIYKHVPGKDGILDGVVELLLEELETTRSTATEWRAHLAEAARRLHALSQAHPNAFPLLRRRSVSAYVAGRSMAEQAMGRMVAGGFARGDAICAMRTVVRFVLGFALSAPAPGAPAGAPEVAGSDYPLVEALLETVADPACEDGLFEYGLDALIRGLRPGNTAAPPP